FVSLQIKDVTRNIKKAVVAATLEELRSKVAEKFDHIEDQPPTIHLDSDGTEIDDEEYFRTLDENTELIAVFPGEHWIDPTNYVTITSHHRGSNSGIVGSGVGSGGVGVGVGDQPTDTTDAAAETARIKQLVGQLQNNLCNVSVLSDPDLDSLSNMDPNSLVDITGKVFLEQLKDSGRPLCAKRNAEDRINLLKLLREGAIFCSERYPEDAEAIDMEISRQLNMDVAQTTTTVTTNTNTTTTITANTTTVNIGVLTPQQQQQQLQQLQLQQQLQQQQQQQLQQTNKTNKTIEQVQNVAAAAVVAAAQRRAAMEAQMTSVDVVTIVETHVAAAVTATATTQNTQNNNQQKLTTAASSNNNNKTNDI
ncbi:LOW QUALITY PROTEIN: DNA fragmentation factor subunit alpha-like, partial [Ceratitis capitata]|uniref:LOW QUALITY PROTEIN: DNA fragmentation factor subunit alpha-like n=1 Tax=Ceratitis capitata TaxID=7213 RepID=UPI000A120894